MAFHFLIAVSGTDLNLSNRIKLKVMSLFLCTLSL